jgi:hypothetical protein
MKVLYHLDRHPLGTVLESLRAYTPVYPGDAKRHTGTPHRRGLPDFRAIAQLRSRLYCKAIPNAITQKYA